MKLVLELLEKTCLNNKNKKAVICEDKSITYDELLQNSKSVGSYLINYIVNNEPVAVFMDKGIDTLEAFFGILYAGGCYSLVNPEFPEVRIKQIISTLESNVIITDNENISKAKELFSDKKIFTMETLKENSINENILNKIRNKKLDIDPVYINFTSGSTGVPKGVVVSSRSVIDFIKVFAKNFSINNKDIIANQAPFDFDVSVKDIYSSLYVGATLLIVPRKLFSSPANLIDYLVDNKATTLIWAVSALCLITTFHALDYKVPKDINKIIFSGEVMPLKHLNIWISHLPNVMYVNVYGPTEITCNCTYYVIDNNKEYLESIPIGIPFDNEKILLLDDNNKLVTSKNVTGELCVSGTCLSLGYYNNKEQTDKHFCQNPLNNKYIETIYRTGDLVKYDNDNNLVFMGRKDFQIKYMGHRIELEEIDREISKIDGIKRVITIFYEKKSKLYAFYIGDIEKEEIINQMKKDLPEYMIPSIFKKVEDFKLTKNGKIDRKVLMEIIESK